MAVELMNISKSNGDNGDDGDWADFCDTYVKKAEEKWTKKLEDYAYVHEEE
jgi:hypothetical protein